MAICQMEWKLVTTNRNPLLAYELKMAGFRLGFRDVLGFDYANLKWIRGEIYAHVPTHAALGKAITERYEGNPRFLDRLFAQERIAAKRLLRTSNEIAELRNESRRTMLRAAQQFFEQYPRLTVFLMVNVVCGAVLEKKLEAMLCERPELKADDQRRRDLTVRLAEEAPPNRTTLANRLLAEIGNSEIADNRNALVETFLKRFAWISLEDGFGTPIDREEAIRRANTMRVAKPEANLQTDQSRDNQHKELWSAGLNLTLTERTVARHFQEIVFLRMFINDEINRCGFAARPFFVRLAQNLGTTYELLLYARADEILRCLTDETRLAQDDLKERRRGYAIVMQDGCLTMFWGKHLARLDEGAAQRASVGHVFHGQVACKGQATGPVRIVLDASQLNKLRQGDILIAGALTPDYMAGIQKAAGIASDVGGMNCHASIISREFGIPCVVGFDNASRLLRDGDVVHLNADTGTLTKRSDATQAAPVSSSKAEVQ